MKIRITYLFSLPFSFWVMFLNTFIMAIGFFMLVPVLALYLLEDLALTASVVGVIVAVRTFSQQGMMVLCGTLADRWGYKLSICAGVLIRAMGFALFGFVESISGLLIAGILSGLGGALFHPASYATYAVLTDTDNRVMIYSIREILSNQGYIVGPLIGGFLITWNFKFVCILSSLLFFGTFFFTYFCLPNYKGKQEPLTFWNNAQLVWKNRAFLRFMCMMMGTWFLFVQLYLVVPIRVQDVMSTSSGIGYIYTTGAITMVVLQVPFSKMATSLLQPFQTLAMGTFFLALGLVVIGFTPVSIGIYIGVMLFTMGQILTQPMMNNLVSQYAGNDHIASYFGFNGFGLAIGGFIGNIVGGYLYELNLMDGLLPWIIFGVHGILFTLLFLYAHHKEVDNNTIKVVDS